MHKRVCSEDSLIKPHVPIEMAVERVLKGLPSQETAPADATCYICLDHDSKLVRGCACRGESAGFVHLECLIEFAERNDEGSMGRSFLNCINCKQGFTGALQLQLMRRRWRRHRDESVESRHLVESCNMLGLLLGRNDENGAEDRLLDAISNSSHFDKGLFKLKLVSIIAIERPEEALKLLEEVVSQAKKDGDLTVTIFAYIQYISALQRLERYEEIVAMATACLESVKASCGDYSYPAWIEHKHIALELLAFACGMTGRFDESRQAFDELIASGTRTYGHKHENTRSFFTSRALCLRKMVGKASVLASRDDLANSASYLDAVLIEIKARDMFDAKDPIRSISR